MRGDIDQLDKGNLLRMLNLEADCSKTAMIQRAVATILRMPERMMISSFPPVPHPVLQILNDFGEVMLVFNIRIVVGVKAEEQEPGSRGIGTLIGLL